MTEPETFTRWEVRSEELRRSLRDLLDSVEREAAHVTIKRYDRPVSVIVPKAWYDGDPRLATVLVVTPEDAAQHAADRAGNGETGEPS
jgi:hypothetical protein